MKTIGERVENRETVLGPSEERRAREGRRSERARAVRESTSAFRRRVLTKILWTSSPPGPFITETAAERVMLNALTVMSTTRGENDSLEEGARKMAGQSE